MLSGNLAEMAQLLNAHRTGYTQLQSKYVTER
jgi:hypothetical protein